MYSRHSRKGSLNISVEAIVILILAITMLGLGLAFMQEFFGEATGGLQKIIASLDKSRIDALLASDDPITFETTNIQLDGTTTEAVFAIRNILGDDITFDVKNGFECYDAIGTDGQDWLNANREGIKFETFDQRLIRSGKTEVLPLLIKIPAKAPQTIYSCRLSLDAQGEEFVKEFFMSYKGG